MTSSPSWAKVAAMFAIVAAVVGAPLSAFKPRASLVAENLALRQQLAALRRKVRRHAPAGSLGADGSAAVS
jgi:hypothetical protein